MTVPAPAPAIRVIGASLSAERSANEGTEGTVREAPCSG
jgi:hypothetical protein